MSEWQEQYLTSERSERVRYCSCHENIKFISSSQRVMFFLLYGETNSTKAKGGNRDFIERYDTQAPFIWSRVPETTLHPSYPGRGKFKLIPLQNQPTVYIRIANPSWGARQLGKCLTSAGRVTLESGTTFLHMNASARLTKTTLCLAKVT